MLDRVGGHVCDAIADELIECVDELPPPHDTHQLEQCPPVLRRGKLDGEARCDDHASRHEINGRISTTRTHNGMRPTTADDKDLDRARVRILEIGPLQGIEGNVHGKRVTTNHHTHGNS
jgi:hypothetical protein